MRNPLWGCILIGGKSSRMGQPKHLLVDNRGVTWLENQVAVFMAKTDEVILAGKGEVPESLIHLTQIPDVADAQGPLAGILAAMRWQPHVSWLICACDMVQIQQDAIEWLLSYKKPGIWGVVPQHPKSGMLEPLFACYDKRCRYLFEALLNRREWRLRFIAGNDKICTPELPIDLANAWENYNTPEDVARLRSRDR